ncbi:MAG TPA: ABC transporter permease, partial [Stellaceae bacterium]|nr:ABC transporter permease [Stellaceae bacterium]
MTGGGGRSGFAFPLHLVRRAASILVVVTLTFFGRLLVTFGIGRVMPIDPVLAAVGDRATAEVYQRTRIELGLDLP